MHRKQLSRPRTPGRGRWGHCPGGMWPLLDRGPHPLMAAIRLHRAPGLDRMLSVLPQASTLGSRPLQTLQPHCVTVAYTLLFSKLPSPPHSVPPALKSRPHHVMLHGTLSNPAG